MNINIECQKAAKMSVETLSAARLRELSSSFMEVQSQRIQDKYTENLAVFDCNQNYIGPANWYFVHYFGFYYTATSILVFVKETNRYVLQHRSATVSWPNLLDCSAGGCYPDPVVTEHNRIEHAKKELAEELYNNYPNYAGLALSKLGNCFSSSEIKSSDGHFYKNHFIHFYLHEISSDQQKLLVHNDEVKRLVSLTASEILTTPRTYMAPGLLTAVDLGLFR